MAKFIRLLIGLVVIAVFAQIYVATNFKNLAEDLSNRVASAPKPSFVSTNIPQAILKFVERAGVKPDQLATTIRLTQIAEMRLSKGGDWQALTAKQTISTGEMGFVWVAEQPLDPFGILTKFRVIDAYVAGHGQLNVRILGSIPVAESFGPDVDIAEAMRYLGELVWAPDAMIGYGGLNWEETADGKVVVSFELPVGIAEMTYSFNEAGDIVEIFGEGRPAEIVDGKLTHHDWVIKVSDYKNLGGRRIPTRGEVGYVYDDGYEAYWRGEIVSYNLQF